MSWTIPNDLLIDGEFLPASDHRRLEVLNPATEEAIDSVPVATDADLKRALLAAERGWRRWKEVDAWSRSSVLRRMAQLLRERIPEIAPVLTAEQGKPLLEAKAELAATADQFDWYADEARRIYGRVIEGHSRAQRLLVLRESVGPVAAFSPWNFPALLPSRKIAPALAAGCSILVKPAEEAPRTALCIGQIGLEAGLPPGVLQMVTGDPAHISQTLIASSVIRKVTLTGSVPVGKTLLRLCADTVKPVTMELGGHSPVLVLEDANVEAAAELVARAKFRNNGQVCIAASRFFVQESVMEAFASRFVAVIRSLRLGDGTHEGIDIGPLSNRRRLEATLSLVDDAVTRGARVLHGGKRPAAFPRGFFFEPTVLTDVSFDMRIMQEEPFCPVAPLCAFKDLEEGLRLANSTPYGLAGYVFTQNLRQAWLAAEGLEAGMIGINGLALATAEAPFGGIKTSGFGREGGSEGIESYTVTKYVNMTL